MLATLNTRSKRHSATTGLKIKLTAGRNFVHILDAFVQSALQPVGT